MKKYIVMKVKAGNQVLNLQMELDKFIEESGIEIDPDEDINEFTNGEIGDYAVENFSDEDTRYNMGIDGEDIEYVGFEILDEDSDELM